MIVFAWADPEELRAARAHIRRSLGIVDDHQQTSNGFDGRLRLYAKPEECEVVTIRNRLVRVQVRADYV